MRVLVLFGLPGCGSSTVSSILAHKINTASYDTDELLVKNIGKVSLQEVVCSYSETEYRQAEADVVTSIFSILERQATHNSLNLLESKLDSHISPKLSQAILGDVSYYPLKNIAVVALGSGVIDYNNSKNLFIENNPSTISHLKIEIFFLDVPLDKAILRSGMLGGVPGLGTPRRLWLNMAAERQKKLKSYKCGTYPMHTIDVGDKTADMVAEEIYTRVNAPDITNI